MSEQFDKKEESNYSDEELKLMLLEILKPHASLIEMREIFDWVRGE